MVYPDIGVSRRKLADLIADELGANPEWVNRVLERFLEDVTAVIAGGGKVNLRGFGVLEPRVRPAGVYRKPDTGEALEVPPRRTVVLRPARVLLRRLNEDSGG